MLSSRRTGHLSATKSRSSLDSQKCYQSRRTGRINWFCFVLFSAFTTVVDSAKPSLLHATQQHSQNKTPTLGKHLIFADSVSAGLNCYQIMIPHPTPRYCLLSLHTLIYTCLPTVHNGVKPLTHHTEQEAYASSRHRTQGDPHILCRK